MIIPAMTPPQLRAATSDDRLCYVKAGPGSGKTFTAAEAFGYLRLVRFRDDNRGICGVTFCPVGPPRTHHPRIRAVG
jgi:superfamily I DNA/RNA helicase